MTESVLQSELAEVADYFYPHNLYYFVQILKFSKYTFFFEGQNFVKGNNNFFGMCGNFLIFN
jgi:hypothetical protein